MTPIPLPHLREVCAIGSGPTTCAFIALGHDGMCCAKGTDMEPQIRSNVAFGVMVAVGDNCPGLNGEEGEA